VNIFEGLDDDGHLIGHADTDERVSRCTAVSAVGADDTVGDYIENIASFWSASSRSKGRTVQLEKTGLGCEDMGDIAEKLLELARRYLNWICFYSCG
jgi:hypothetical protein